MESKIEYDKEATLSAPEGGPLKSISVTIQLEPKDAGIIIHGRLANGTMGSVEVHGAHNTIDLPFVKPTIYIKYLHGLTHLNLVTLGFELDR